MLRQKKEKDIIAVPPKDGPKPGFSNSKPAKQQRADAAAGAKPESGAADMTSSNITKEKRDNAGLPDATELPKA